MSKWRKALKNKRRFDARYFLGERREGQEEVIENSVQQEKLKRNFHDFSFDSWLNEDQDLDEMHCNSKRDDDEELEEMHCNSKRDDDLEEMHCNSKRDDDLEEEYKPDFLDLDKDGDKKEPMKKAAKDKDSMGEGHDGATKGHSEMSPATKDREMRPFDYDHGQIGDEVFEEESVIGQEEEEPRYGEAMEELVVPGIMPKGDANAKGMTPEQIKMSKAKAKAKKAREDAKKKGLGPVVDEG
tara:strand:- start:701 stop:1423 length:723 start_codon:yes stop_codon:yes gene_type:complete